MLIDELFLICDENKVDDHNGNEIRKEEPMIFFVCFNLELLLEVDEYIIILDS